MGDISNNGSDIFNSPSNEASLKGTLALHPLFTKIMEEILDALCEDCRIKVETKFNDYLRDVNPREDLEELTSETNVPARKHPDLLAFLEIRNKVVWEDNKHLECYAMSWSRLRFLCG